MTAYNRVGRVAIRLAEAIYLVEHGGEPGRGVRLVERYLARRGGGAPDAPPPAPA